jgi:hypothetical protein
MFRVTVVQISGKIRFFGVYFVEKIDGRERTEISLPEDFRSTDPSTTTLHGSANPHFVILRGCDFIDFHVKSPSFK